MADRIIAMREKLYNTLVELKTPGEWGHIKSQIGELGIFSVDLSCVAVFADRNKFRHVLFHRSQT